MRMSAYGLVMLLACVMAAFVMAAELPVEEIEVVDVTQNGGEGLEANGHGGVDANANSVGEEHSNDVPEQIPLQDIKEEDLPVIGSHDRQEGDPEVYPTDLEGHELHDDSETYEAFTNEDQPHMPSDTHVDMDMLNREAGANWEEFQEAPDPTEEELRSQVFTIGGEHDRTNPFAMHTGDASWDDGDDAPYEPVPELEGVHRVEVEAGLCYPAWRFTEEDRGDSSVNGGWAWVKRAVPSFGEEPTDTISPVRQSEADKNGKCDMESGDAADISPEEFHSKYVEKGIPVLVRGVVKHEKWRAATAWTKDKILTAYGGLSFRVGLKPPFLADEMTLDQFVRSRMETSSVPPPTPGSNHSLYVWDDVADVSSRSHSQPLKDALKLSLALRKDVKLPSLLSSTAGFESEQYAFTLGPACTGTHIHTHPRGANILLFGLKRWILHAPVQEDHHHHSHVLHGSEHHILDWFRALYPGEYKRTGKASATGTKSTLECYQHAGDLVYIPDMWHHGVLNVHGSLAVSFQASVDNAVLAQEAFVAIDANNDTTIDKRELFNYIARDYNMIYAKPPPEELEQHGHKTDKLSQEALLAAVQATAWKHFDKQETGKVTQAEFIEQWEIATHAIDRVVMPGYFDEPVHQPS